MALPMHEPRFSGKIAEVMKYEPPDIDMQATP